MFAETLEKLVHHRFVPKSFILDTIYDILDNNTSTRGDRAEKARGREAGSYVQSRALIKQKSFTLNRQLSESLVSPFEDEEEEGIDVQDDSSRSFATLKQYAMWIIGEFFLELTSQGVR